MKIGIANDHRGYKVKKIIISKLRKQGHTVYDLGTDSDKSVDYPEFAFKLCEKVISDKLDYGIAICGTGIGMSIACNKVKGIRCAKIDNYNDAKYAKCHNNANVIALSANNKIFKIMKMIKIFNSNEPNLEKKYIRRNDNIKEYEDEH